MSNTVKKKDEIFIELVGGPRDGEVLRMNPPYYQKIQLQSKLRSDVFHLYEYDTSPKNVDFPLKYLFKGYTDEKADPVEKGL
jgi:hypothetical protein